jgi:hypothetical protein
VPDSLFAPVAPAFRAAAETFIPEIAMADAATWNRLTAIISETLASRPAGLQRQVLLFIRLLDLGALARHGKRLARLDSARRTRFLERVAASRLLLLRRGMWGLRTLVQMGWYGQPEIQQSLGYRASPAGWSAPR